MSCSFRSVLKNLIIFFFVIIINSAASFSAHCSLIFEPLELSSVIREVVLSHPEINEAIHVYEGVKDEIGEAESGFKPQVSTELSVGQEYTDGVDTNEEAMNLTASTATLTARQNLYDGKENTNLVSETKARVMAAAYDALNVANSVFVDTVSAYLSMMKEYDLLKLAEKNVYIQAQILKQIKIKTESGFGRGSDLLNAESRLALARANYISQQQNVKQAGVKLHKHLGRFVDPSQLIMPEPHYELPENVEDVVQLSLKHYPALEVAKYNLAARKYGMKKVESRYLPTVDAELRANYSNNTGGDEGDTQNYSAMLYLNYDIYDGGRKSYEKQRNYKQVLKEHERRYIERRNLNESVRLAWNIKEAEDRKFGFLKEHVDLSEKTLEAYKEEYQLGRRTLLELLDMENEHQSAQKSLVESRFAALEAHYRVLYVTGVLLYEQETVLFDKVGLKKKKIDIDLLSEYGKLEKNRDGDTVDDETDLCDNSIFNSAVLDSGCKTNETVVVGYSVPDTVEDYIKPKQAALTLDTGTDGASALSLGEPEGELTLGEAETVEPLEGAPADDTPAEVTAPAEDVRSITFEPYSTRLTESSAAVLKEIAESLSTLDSYVLVIAGHTDSSGSAAVNKKLSAGRAESVYKELLSNGISAENMRHKGMGDTQPLFDNDTEEGRAKNRRIELRLHLGSLVIDMTRTPLSKVADRRFGDMNFQLESNRLTAESVENIEKIADQLRSLDDYKLDISGHTDSTGGAKYNKKLSYDRAKTVYNELVKNGIDAEKVSVTGKGEAEPLFSNKTREGRIKNRRIEFFLQ